MLRVRFRTSSEDHRSINWPIKYPYWCTGDAGDGSYSVIVAYADNLDYIHDNWPEAENIDANEVDRIVFSGRFPKPDWYKE